MLIIFDVVTDLKMTYHHCVEAKTWEEAQAIGERLAHEAFENGDYEMDTDSQVSEVK